MRRRQQIGLVVEGTPDRVFFIAQKTWFNKKGYYIQDVIQTGGFGNMASDATGHVSALHLKGCRKVFFMVDMFERCSPATASRFQSVKGNTEVEVCVMVQELEAWFLADLKAVKKITGQTRRGGYTDKIKYPKEELKKLFRKKLDRVPTEMSMAQAFRNKFSFERARKRNRSLARFISKL